jgi:uncharacterized membrane protein YphA (DoxX/SURF4 family)
MESVISVNKNAVKLLRISIGIIYFWFGILKFFPGYSPAEELAISTINALTFNYIPSSVNIVLLASWEVIVGILMIFGLFKKPTLVLMLIHMVCTFTPMLFFPKLAFNTIPYGFTIVGQYIMKNIIIISASWILWEER